MKNRNYEKPLAELICFELESVRMIKLTSGEGVYSLKRPTGKGSTGHADFGDLN